MRISTKYMLLSVGPGLLSAVIVFYGLENVLGMRPFGLGFGTAARPDMTRIVLGVCAGAIAFGLVLLRGWKHGVSHENLNHENRVPRKYISFAVSSAVIGMLLTIFLFRTIAYGFTSVDYPPKDTPFVNQWISNPDNGHDYLLMEPLNWHFAHNYALDEGMYLATINDAAENDWIMNRFRLNSSTWIGLVPTQDGKTWRWSNGDSSTFRNWRRGQPRTSKGSSFAIIRPEWRSAPGTWDSIPGMYPCYVLVERDGPPSGF